MIGTRYLIVDEYGRFYVDKLTWDYCILHAHPFRLKSQADHTAGVLGKDKHRVLMVQSYGYDE